MPAIQSKFTPSDKTDVPNTLRCADCGILKGGVCRDDSCLARGHAWQRGRAVLDSRGHSCAFTLRNSLMKAFQVTDSGCSAELLSQRRGARPRRGFLHDIDAVALMMSHSALPVTLSCYIDLGSCPRASVRAAAREAEASACVLLSHRAGPVASRVRIQPPAEVSQRRRYQREPGFRGVYRR